MSAVAYDLPVTELAAMIRQLDRAGGRQDKTSWVWLAETMQPADWGCWA